LRDLGSEGALLFRESRSGKQFRVAKHGGEGIIKFVGCASQELPERSKFL
jgi:hypothetical protein